MLNVIHQVARGWQNRFVLWATIVLKICVGSEHIAQINTLWWSLNSKIMFFNLSNSSNLVSPNGVLCVFWGDSEFGWLPNCSWAIFTPGSSQARWPQESLVRSQLPIYRGSIMDIVKIGAGMLGWKTHYGVSIEQFPSYDQRKPKPTISVRTSLEILYGP